MSTVKKRSRSDERLPWNHGASVLSPEVWKHMLPNECLKYKPVKNHEEWKSSSGLDEPTVHRCVGPFQSAVVDRLPPRPCVFEIVRTRSKPSYKKVLHRLYRGTYNLELWSMYELICDKYDEFPISLQSNPIMREAFYDYVMMLVLSNDYRNERHSMSPNVQKEWNRVRCFQYAKFQELLQDLIAISNHEPVSEDTLLPDVPRPLPSTKETYLQTINDLCYYGVVTDDNLGKAWPVWGFWNTE